MAGQDDTSTTTDSTTESTTVASTTETTTQAQTPAQAETANVGPNPTPVVAAPTTDLNASGSVASPAVAEPANDPTTNDVEQTAEERFADARTDALHNHAAALGQAPSDESSSEEAVA
jgi:hypothetical protein